jgi:hypothetical protein
MKKVYSLLLFTLLVAYANAQLLSIEKWRKHTIDSLHKKKIDTILYYHEYCDECSVKNPLPYKIAGLSAQIVNTVIYRQNGEFFSLQFNCAFPPVKKQLPVCKSISYAISVIPVFEARDRSYDTMRKAKKFPPPTITDGVYAEVTIYCNRKEQSASMSMDMPDDLFKVWRQYFWFDKEDKLLKLVRADITQTEN